MFLSRDVLTRRKDTFAYSRAEKVNAVRGPYGDWPIELLAKLGEYVTPQPFVAQFEDVRLLGPAGVGVTPDEHIILETAFAGRYDAAEKNADYIRTMGQFHHAPPLTVDFGVSMIGTWSSYYFHWMLEQLPKLQGVDAYMTDRIIKEDRSLDWPTLIIQKNPPSFVTETLDMLGYKYVETTGNVLVKQLLVPSHRRHQGRTAPGVIAWLRENVKRDDQKRLWPRRVLISRIQASERRFMNGNGRDNSHKIADATGHNLTLLENWHVETQASMFERADSIIAPHGGGLVNMVFGNKLSIFEAFSPVYINPCFYLLAAACGHRYIPLMGDAMAKDIVVDIPKLVGLVEKVRLWWLNL